MRIGNKCYLAKFGYFSTPFNYSNGINSDRQKQINSLVSKVVETTGAEYLDVSNLLLNKKDYFIDGVHPNNAGANEIEQIVFNRISELQFK